MSEIVYVLFGHNHYDNTDFYGVFYSVEQAEEHMKDLIGVTDEEGVQIYFYDVWIIIPQIVGNPDEDTEDVIFYNFEGIRRD